MVGEGQTHTKNGAEGSDGEGDVPLTLSIGDVHRVMPMERREVVNGAREKTRETSGTITSNTVT